MDDLNPGNLSQFSALCGLASFVVNNSENMFTFYKDLTSAEVSILASLFASGAEIENLMLRRELPAGTAAELGSAIRRSGVSDRYLSIWVGERNPAPELVQLVAAAPIVALEQLTISDLTIDEKCTTQICDSLAASPRLRSLTISHCKISAPLLARRIGSFRALESFEISCEYFGPSEIEMILVGMRDLPVVVDLMLEYVEIEAGGRRELGGLLGRINRKFSLANTQLGDEGISAIVDAVIASGRKGLRLQELCLSEDSIGPMGAQKLAGLIARSPYLRCLNLYRNANLAVGAADIVGKCANSLQELDISGCMLNHQNIAALFSHGCHALTVLKMEANEAGDLGAGVVAQFLLHYGGRILRELRMDISGIGEAGALELANGLEKAYAIRCISMDENLLGPRGATAVLNALATASTVPMEIISFAKCKIGDDGASAVGKIITHRGCKHFELDYNEIHCRGVKAIADSVNASACMIESLNLYANPFDDEGVGYLFTGLHNRTDSSAGLK